MLEQLQHTLRLLACEPDDALMWLRAESEKVGGGVDLGVDEIALDFENWARASWQLVEEGMITQSLHDDLLSLNEEIEAIGTDPINWSGAAFKDSATWRAVRARAAEILRQMETAPQKS